MPTLAPQINVTLGVTRTPRARPAVTAAGAIVGVSRTGPVATLTRASKLNDHGAWLSDFGGGSVDEGRLTHSVDHDWIEEFFQDGGAGAGLYYSRAVGPNPVFAKWQLTGTGVSLEVLADEYGDLPNEKKIKVINGPVGGSGFRVIQLTETDGTTVIAQTVEFNDRTQVNGLKLDAGGPTPLTIKLGAGSGLPNVAAAAAPGTSGTDDHANITQTQIDAAIGRLGADIGNLNVAAPNWGTATVGQALMNHAFLFNRYAAIDTLDTANKSTVLTQAGSLQGLPNAEHASLITPWIDIPALTTDGQPRAVPGSALQLAKWAETDGTDGPNQAAAGRWGVSTYATGVRASYSSQVDRDDLANAGVTRIVVDNDEVKVFDNLTLVEPDGNEHDLLQNQNVRYLKAKVWQFTYDAADEHFGKVTRDALAGWKVQMEGHLLRDFLNGDLFPDDDDPRASTAFNVNTGGSAITGPNSTATINAGQKNALVGVRPTKGGRIINIAISNVGLTTPVA